MPAASPPGGQVSKRWVGTSSASCWRLRAAARRPGRNIGAWPTLFLRSIPGRSHNQGPGADRERVSPLEMRPDLKWADWPWQYRASEITRVNFGGEYENVLELGRWVYPGGMSRV